MAQSNKVYEKSEVQFLMCSWIREKKEDESHKTTVPINLAESTQNADITNTVKVKHKLNRGRLKLFKNLRNPIQNEGKDKELQQNLTGIEETMRRNNQQLNFQVQQCQTQASEIMDVEDENLPTRITCLSHKPTYENIIQTISQPSYQHLKHKRCKTKLNLQLLNERLITFANPGIQESKDKSLPTQNNANEILQKQESCKNILAEGSQQIKRTVSIIRFKEIQNILLKKSDSYTTEKQSSNFAVEDLIKGNDFENQILNSFSLSLIGLVPQPNPQCEKELSKTLGDEIFI